MGFLKYARRIGVASALFAGLIFPMAVQAEGEYETREVTTYIYDRDHTATTTLVFKKDLPTIAYISMKEYMDRVLSSSFAEEKQSDGTILISNASISMKVDMNKDTIVSFQNGNNEDDDEEIDMGEMLDSKYIRSAETGYVGDKKGELYDLGKYGIDILDVDGKVYMPLPTISDMLAVIYNDAQYLDGKLYYVHSAELLGSGLYYENEVIFDQPIERSRAEADFTYNELCFLVDNLYGAPAKAQLAAAIEEKGFDAALDTDENLKAAKAYLKSTNNAEYMLGLMYLDIPLFDGGHTNISLNFRMASEYYPDSALVKEYRKLLDDPAYETAKKISGQGNMLRGEKEKKEKLLKDLKLKGFDVELDTVKTWENTEAGGGDGDIIATLYASGDTMIFSFDDFENAVVYAFKESVDYAAEHGYKNFVVDVSTNGGGVNSVVRYMITLMKNKNRDSNQITSYSYSRLSENTNYITAKLDLNLDGVFDEADKSVGYDLNFAVLESGVSFSSANELSVLAKENGIMILGETSGGGECALMPVFLTNGLFCTFSAPNKSVLKSGAVVDYGAEPDYWLVKEDKDGNKDYSQMYDAELIGKAVSEYYGSGYSNEWVKGQWYGNANGWYAKTTYQIDGSVYNFEESGYMVVK